MPARATDGTSLAKEDSFTLGLLNDTCHLDALGLPAESVDF